MGDVLAVPVQVGLDCSGAFFGATDFPALLLQADRDPAQARSHSDDATELFPGGGLRWVENSEHFTQLEQPDAVVAVVRDFPSQ